MDRMIINTTPPVSITTVEMTPIWAALINEVGDPVVRPEVDRSLDAVRAAAVRLIVADAKGSIRAGRPT